MGLTVSTTCNYRLDGVPLATARLGEAGFIREQQKRTNRAMLRDIRAVRGRLGNGHRHLAPFHVGTMLKQQQQQHEPPSTSLHLEGLGYERVYSLFHLSALRPTQDE